MDPFHPLNPADLARSGESFLEFGIRPDGRSLILGLPNFLLSISNQDLHIRRPDDYTTTYASRKYELGYDISSADLGWTR